jgi:hypothetical protein
VNPVNRLYACVSGGSGAYTWTTISVNIPRYHTIDPVLRRIHCYNFTQPRKSLVMFLLKTLLTIALGLTFVFSNSIRNSRCCCTSGSECWPSDSEFQTFASQVSQPLIHPAHPATSCYNPASGNCSDVRAHWYNGVSRSDQPGAAQLTNWGPTPFPKGRPKPATSTLPSVFHANRGGCPLSALTPEHRKIFRKPSNCTIYAS